MTRPHEALRVRFLLITALFGFTAAAACGNGQDSGDRAGQGRGRSPREAVAKRPAIQAMAEERIRTSMPKSYDCDHFNLKKVEQVELTPGHLAASDRERWCLHLEYECRTSPTGKRKEFASVVEVIYVDADASVVTDLVMGPLFTWADPGFVGVNWMHCEAGTSVDPPS